jgi:glycopeptide antibiotics resistance protein
VAIEVLQYWGGFRFGDWEDAVADAVGVVLGLLVYQLCMRMYSKNNTPYDQ